MSKVTSPKKIGTKMMNTEKFFLKNEIRKYKEKELKELEKQLFKKL
jgi:hypothetical protein